MRAYPADDLDDTLRNVFDFDVYRIETIERLDEILRKHRSVNATKIYSPALTCQKRRLRAQGTNSTIGAGKAKKKKQLDMQFNPQKTDLDKPKHGQEDPNDEAHSGENTFAGGVSGPCGTC
jgi:von Willebrand factor A domain-containing protein 8